MGTFIVALNESEFFELRLLVSVGFFYFDSQYKSKLQKLFIYLDQKSLLLVQISYELTGLVVVNLELA